MFSVVGRSAGAIFPFFNIFIAPSTDTGVHKVLQGFTRFRSSWLIHIQLTCQKHKCILWWRHQMQTFSALLAICVGIHWSLVNFPHKGQWHRALMLSLICNWTNDWVNKRDAGDLRRLCVHYDVIIMHPGPPLSGRTMLTQAPEATRLSPIKMSYQSEFWQAPCTHQNLQQWQTAPTLYLMISESQKTRWKTAFHPMTTALRST